VVAVIKGVTTYNVKIDIGHGIVITSSITAEAVKDLKLKKGDEACSHYKSLGSYYRQGIRAASAIHKFTRRIGRDV